MTQGSKKYQHVKKNLSSILPRNFLIFSFYVCSAFVMTSGQWVIWQGIIQKCTFLLHGRIILWKVGRWWSEMPPPALRERKKGSGHLGFSESCPPIFFCNHTNTDGHRHKCLQTQMHSSTKTCSNSNILSFSLLYTHTHTHTHTYWETLLSSCLSVQPHCCAELMKSSCHASTWQVSLTK